MNRRVLPVIIGSLLFALACGGNYDPMGLDDPMGMKTCITPFEDANLDWATREALGACGMSDLTCDLATAPLMGLDASHLGIKSLVGIENLTMLMTLDLSGNAITDIGPLSDLESLMILNLANNPDLSDIEPLLDNAGLGRDDLVRLQATSVSCADVAALQDNGVSVFSDCP